MHALDYRDISERQRHYYVESLERHFEGRVHHKFSTKNMP